MASNPIRPALFLFLGELAANNDRAWFEANRQRYLDDVREPLLRFIADFGPHLRGISRHMRADPRPVGGSLFRIHRDTRFSRDKRPYKTQAGITFRHAAGRDVHGPIFYLHLEPGNVFAAAGMWMPPADALARIRDAIVARPKVWARVVANLPLDDSHGGFESRLRRPPRGYDPEHPHIEDLKRKSFTVSTGFTEQDATSAAFAERVAAACAAATPLMRFLTKAVELPF